MDSVAKATEMTATDRCPWCSSVIPHAQFLELGELHGSEQYYRLLIERSSDVILVLDQAGTILFVGGAGREDLGYEIQDAIGTNAYSFVHPDNLAEQAETTRLAFQEPGRTVRSEAQIRRKDGSWITCEFVGQAGTDPSGKPVLITTMRNITERKLAEARLQRVCAP